ncbi:MAG TPA: HIT domain-containing protein [Phycisphaeraceae bacterium]|nr:HIT domain-containing protein [Phycisphaeraceae bacterium]
MAHDALHAPWRMEYLEALGEAEKKLSRDKDQSCFLSDYWEHPELDTQNHVLYRDGEGMILLNRYPYSNGHLLVALGEGRPRLLDYTQAQRTKLMELTSLAAAIIEEGLNPQGINIGINQGRAAGAGVPGHLHVHLVPRWSGDTNFITVVGEVRVIPASLSRMAERFRAVVRRLTDQPPA